MNATNTQSSNKRMATMSSKEKSLIRIKNFSSPGRLPKLDVKKSAALTFAYETEEKNCVNSSKIPRPQVTASYSYNENLKSNLHKGKTKKAPSMIPRSNSRKRNESDQIKVDLCSKAESSKEESNKNSLSKNEKSVSDLVYQESEFMLLNAKVNQSSSFIEVGKENLKQELFEKTSLSLSSCHNLLEIKEENSDTSYKDAQESLGSPNIKPSSWKGLPKQIRNPRYGENHELEEENQQRTIRNLYETIKNTVGPLFEKWTSSKKIPNNEIKSDLTMTEEIKETKNAKESAPDFLNVQDHYEFTLKEISNIWKNAISLIGSVKDHTVKFVEGNNLSVDKEQLTLEAEMLQLAIDFAISYSKLKTDFLIKSVRKTLNIKDLEKSELEAFIDSKIFAAVYSDEDLAAMARTVQDLNLSVLKGEDLEYE